MPYQFKNNASSAITANISTGALSVNISPADAAKYPVPSGTSFFMATLVKSTGESEIVKVTSNPLDGSFVIERANEGTTALSFVIGDFFEHRLTAGALNSMAQKNSELQTGLNAQYLNGTEVVTVATANKILALDADSELPANIKGNSATTTLATNSSLLENLTSAQIISQAKTPQVYTAGSNIVYRETGPITTNSLANIKVLEVLVPSAGVYTVNFNVRGTGIGSSSYARIYINDVAAGTIRNINSSTVTAVPSEDISLSVGDLFQIYAYTDSAADPCEITEVTLSVTENGTEFVRLL